MRDVLWAPVSEPGLEHLRLAPDYARSVLIGVDAGRPYTFSYRVGWDSRWQVRTVEARVLGDDSSGLVIRSDGAGRWQTGQAEPLPELDGCIDIDFTASPFTNTLPIRRLGLQLGQSAELRVVYITVPTLVIEPATQRYTRLDADHYRYESGNFSAELPVDEDGVVLDYPGYWRRIR